ncbi:hypothetical protein FB107DRAFT_280679 [Schizophyllum commune]
MPNRFKAPSVSTLSATSSISSLAQAIPGAFPSTPRGSQAYVPEYEASGQPRPRTPDEILRTRAEFDAMKIQYDNRIAWLHGQLANEQGRADRYKRMYEEQYWSRLREAQALRHQLAKAREDLVRTQQERDALAALVNTRQRPAAATLDPSARYEAEWSKMWKQTVSASSYTLQSFPWPLLDFDGVESITEDRVLKFLLDDKRPGVSGKPVTSVIRNEALRFHPDKFATFALCCIVPEDHAIAKEVAAAITVVLMRVLMNSR